MACGIAVWIGVSEALYNTATIKSLGKTFPCLYATVASTFVPLPLTIVLSQIFPDKDFEWADLLSIERIEDDEHGKVSSNTTRFDAAAYFTPDKVAYMKRMSRIALYVGVFKFVAQWVLWPLPMYGAYFIFSKGLVIAWVVVALIWLWLALFVSNFLPLIDGGARKIWIVLTGRTVLPSAADSPQGSTGVVTPENRESEVKLGQQTEVKTKAY